MFRDLHVAIFFFRLIAPCKYLTCRYETPYYLTACNRRTMVKTQQYALFKSQTTHTTTNTTTINTIYTQKQQTTPTPKQRSSQKTIPRNPSHVHPPHPLFLHRPILPLYQPYRSNHVFWRVGRIDGQCSHCGVCGECVFGRGG